ncbi:GDSL-type esterase/lipase family protein [Schaalia vaccimaxillae]|uniref:GDSL-type esterase/lipase family protein n=1 Tax=Schaalia vaccimaxillae TaxID=183916 RepID=UPI0003B537D9|nr:GDSL-type esterase/lipase family protein [Schaalia vaccimaxillae]
MTRKNILCFGDSNTWGYTPGTGERYAPNVRWPGVMADKLGAGYHVAEDGISGRTTSFDFPWSESKNGQSALPYALLSQKPLDLLIIALGINDLSVVDSSFSAQSAAALIRRTRMLQAVPDAQTPIFPNGVKILIAAPAPVHPDYDEQFQKSYYQESLLLTPKYSSMAHDNGVYCLNVGDYASASPLDCVHFSEESHYRLGEAMAEKVKEIFGDTDTH